MTEYIEREAAIKAANEGADIWDGGSNKGRYKHISDALNAVPAADVAPVKHGRWIWDENGMDWGLGAWVCSECHSKSETWWGGIRIFNPLRCSGSRFCGNCGAKMKEEA